MATIKIGINSRIKKDGTAAVFILVRWGNNKMVLPTGLSCIPSDFANGEFTKRVIGYKAKNAFLIDKKAKIELFFLENEAKMHSMSKERIKSLIECKALNMTVSAGDKTFIDYLDEFVSKKSKEGTRTIYTTTRNKIIAYDAKCTFKSMDRKWLERFEHWMVDSGMKTNAYAHPSAQYPCRVQLCH